MVRAPAVLALDQVFPDIARQESRAIEAFDDAGAAGTYLLRELYCAAPECDCRRVLLQVIWVERRTVAASIDYTFEQPRRRGEPQVSLDPLNPQSARSESLLRLVTHIITTDAAYRARLQAHYRMMKAAGVAASPVPRTKAKPRTRRPAPAPALTSLVAKQSAGADRKLQQTFRRALEKVDRLRQRVQAWRAQRSDIDRDVAVYLAALERQRRAVREMVIFLDRASTNALFSKVDRKELGALITDLAAELLEAGGDDELKPIYNRHSRSDFDADAAADEAAMVASMKAMMETFGVDLGDNRINSLDELAAFAAEKQRALNEQAAARAGRRKPSARQAAAQALRDEDRQRTHRAMQDVYRSLAKALHPDREQDPTEQQRKTVLMQQVNVAYEANDLLRLLELELELERVERTQVEAIAEDRLRRYVSLLAEQARQLAVELEEVERPYRMDLGLSPTARLAPADVVAQLRADRLDADERTRLLTDDLAAFQDLRRLKAWLKVDRRRASGRAGRDLFT